MTPIFQSKLTDDFNPDVSVIIPTYNRISMLEEALASVYSQTFDGTVEIIVVDDHSQDGTSEIIRQKYPTVRLIHLTQNVGWPAARNRGILEARGQYIAGLDSDDLWEPGYLQSQISALEGHDKSFCVSAATLWYTEENQKLIYLQKPDLARFTSGIHQLLVTSSFIKSPSSVIFPKNIFQDVGLYDETFKVGADREFYARCLIWGYQPIFIEQPLVLLRKHNQGQLTDFNDSKIELRKQSRISFLEKLTPLIEEQQLTIPPANRLYAEIYSTAAREFFREKYYLQWLKTWIDVAEYTSIKYALFNMMRDILRFIKSYLPTSILTAIRQFFLSNTLST